MSVFQSFHWRGRSVVVGVLIAVLAGILAVAQPAFADGTNAPRYVAADGSDLTAFAQCLPKRLSQPSLARALQESRNDFIEKVFDVKDNYRDYKLDEAEIAHLDCMKQKGVTPRIEQ